MRPFVANHGLRGPVLAVALAMFVLGSAWATAAAAGPIAPGATGMGSSVGAHPDVRRAGATGYLQPQFTARFGTGPASEARYGTTAHPDARPPSVRVPGPAFAAPVAVISVDAPGTVPGQASLGTGVQGADSSQCGCAPPDVIDAASSSQVVEMVNLEVTVWSTSGTQLESESLAKFWNAGSSVLLSDPRIAYDGEANRWYSSILLATSSSASVPFAVSQTGDATGNWTVYSTINPPSGCLGDQPILGYSHDLLSLSVNDFCSSKVGAQYWVINKTALLNGSTAAFHNFGMDTSAFSVHPVRSLQPRSGMYLVETLPGAPGGLYLYSVTGVPPANVSVTRDLLAVGNLVAPPPARQPGTSDGLDTATVHVGDALWAAGSVWLTYDAACLVAGSNRSCVRVTQVSTTSTPTVTQDFDIGVNATDLLYGALTVDSAGSLLVEFGLSSKTLNASIAVTYRTTVDPVNTVHTGTMVQTGSAAIVCGATVCRYGDYFGAWTAPGSAVSWVAGEYTTPSTAWSSWVQPVRVPLPMSVTTAAAPSTVDVGETANYWVNVTSSACLPSGAGRCSVQVPFGDGTTQWANCTAISSSLAFTHAFSTTGTFTAGSPGSLRVYPDGNCLSGNVSATFPLSAANFTVIRGTTVGLSASPPGGADVGQSIVLVASAAGGAPPYTFWWSGLPPGCSGSNLSRLDCTPASAGDFTVTVQANDTVGGSAVATLDLPVDPAPSARVSVAPGATDVGQTIVVLSEVTNGSGVYQFVWSGTPPGCEPANVSSFTCAPTSAGKFTLVLTVTDSRGTVTVSRGVVLAVAPAVAVSVVASSSSINSGDTFVLYSTVTGGTGPFTYHWSGLPAGCGSPDAQNVTCTADAGAFDATVTVTDGAGGSASSSYRLVVGGGGGSVLGLSTIELIAVIGGILAVVAIAMFAVGRQRRRRKVPPR